jgi:hypothetical protein
VDNVQLGMIYAMSLGYESRYCLDFRRFINAEIPFEVYNFGHNMDTALSPNTVVILEVPVCFFACVPRVEAPPSSRPIVQVRNECDRLRPCTPQFIVVG